MSTAVVELLVDLLVIPAIVGCGVAFAVTMIDALLRGEGGAVGDLRRWTEATMERHADQGTDCSCLRMRSHGGFRAVHDPGCPRLETPPDLPPRLETPPDLPPRLDGRRG